MTAPDYFSDIDVFQTKASAVFASEYVGKHLPERAAQWGRGPALSCHVSTEVSGVC